MMSPVFRVFVALGLFALVAWLPLKAEKPPELLSIATLDQRPKLVKSVPPVYPRAMVKAGLVGQVVLEMIIGTDGLIEDLRVQSSNNPWFERPALDSVVQWTFTPGLKNGKAVRVRAAQMIDFTLPKEAGKPYLVIQKSANHGKLPADLQWDEAPRVTATAYPVYPFTALLAATEGRATVTCVVGPQGRIVQADVTEATIPEFGRAVLAMLDQWRFVPAKKAGQPCGAWLTMSYEFSAAGEEVPVADSGLAILQEIVRSGSEVFAVEALDQSPKAIFKGDPVFPLALRDRATTGEAMIEFYIDRKGDAQLPRVVSSSAPEFGYAAVQAVARWRFKPPLKDGRPVVARVRIPVVFDASKPAVTPMSGENPARGTGVSDRIYTTDEIKKMGGVPKMVKSAAPVYPQALLRADVTGSVMVAFVINRQGSVESVRAVSSTNKEFEAAACKCVTAWKFKPGTVDGQPVAVRAEQRIEFNLAYR